MRSWVLDYLAQETQPFHAAADGDRLAMLERPEVARYRAYLVHIHGFESCVEAACQETGALDERVVRGHFKAHRLVADLEALGIAPAPPPNRLRFADPIEALAWLWVLHRNTLLHGLSYRYLAGKLPGVMAAAGGYLRACAGTAGALMSELGVALDTATRRGALVERAVVSASDAFRAQRRWYGARHAPDTIASWQPAAPL